MNEAPVPGPIFNPFELEKPWNLRALFGFDGPLELEIGFGRGDFLLHRASQLPGNRFLGLEVSSVSVKKAARALSGAGLSNVRLAKMEASMALFYFVEPESIDTTWILFPDPWPKKRHSSRRLMTRDFLRLLAHRTAPKAWLHLITDWPDYARFVQEQSADCPWFQGGRVQAMVPETKYALKWRAKNRSFFGFSFQKVQHPADLGRFFPEEIKMSQFVLEQLFDLQRAVRDFKPIERETDTGVIKLFKAYISQDNKEALFGCISSENGLVQRFWVSARLRSGKTVIKVAEHSYTVSTPGVAACVGAVRQLLGP